MEPTGLELHTVSLAIDNDRQTVTMHIQTHSQPNVKIRTAGWNRDKPELQHNTQSVRVYLDKDEAVGDVFTWLRDHVSGDTQHAE